MVINSKKQEGSGKKTISVIVVVLLVVVSLVYKQTNKTTDFNLTKNAKQVETAVSISSELNTTDFFDSKSQIHKTDRFSLFLNKELGMPTLMITYKDSLSPLERNGRFLVFLYLKDPSNWRAVNKKWDHILLVKESLIPVEKTIEGRKFFIFKFRLEHPYFSLDNLREMEFVRHTRELGRFEEATIIKDSIPNVSPITYDLKKILIGVKSKHYAKIGIKRREALASGILSTNDDDFVKATVSVNGGEKINAEMRLKGDWTDHLEHPTKWSYRIIPKGDNTVFGMRKFSIQHPKSRNYLWEWLFNKVVKDNELVGLRYDFLNVDLKITDKDSIIPMGLMALEESFDKILIENNKRREGLILGMDESLFWDEMKQVKDLALDYPEDVDLKKSIDLPIKVYNKNKVLSSPVLSKQFEIAKNLVVGLRNGRLKLSEAFDIEKLTLYIALSNLFGGHHGLHVENIRLYYNPVTNKMEPVSFDSNSGNKLQSLREFPIGIHDDLFNEKLIQAYEKVSSQEFIDGFVKKYLEELNDLAMNLSGEFNDAPLDLSILQHNANFIKKKIHPKTIIESSLISYAPGEMKIRIRNFSEFPVLIDGLTLNNGKALNQPEGKIIIAANDTLDYSFKLKESFNNAFVSKKNKIGGFKYPKDLEKVQVTHHVQGASNKKNSHILAFTSTFNEEIIANSTLGNQFLNFKFVELHERKREITFGPGDFKLDRVLSIPVGYLVKVSAGFSLNMINKASIISYSPILFEGTGENPIHFYSKDGTGGGIFVSSAPQESMISHTTFTNLSIPELGLWSLSGAVNFNESTVRITNAVFEKNRSEDALNIIRSEFAMDSSKFIDTFSDSFDGDFVKGSITNTTFINSGNDAIDISGSTINIENIIIDNPADKGLSAGENSKMTGQNVTISDGEIAIVSKDLSRIDLTNITIENTRLGMACFQKKTEFGPGIIDLKDVRFTGIEVTHLIEPSSGLIIDNTPVLEKSKDVIDLMYGKEYGKSSR